MESKPSLLDQIKHLAKSKGFLEADADILLEILVNDLDEEFG